MRSWGLKPRLILVTLSLFLAAGALSFILFLAAARSVVESLGTKFAVTSTGLARSRVLGLIQPEVTLARKLADSPVVKAWMLDERNPGKSAAAWEELASYRRSFADHGFFVALADTGTYFNQPTAGERTVVRLRRDRPADQWFFSTLATVSDWALNLDYNPDLNVTKVWINCIVRDGVRPIGLAGSAIDISSLLGALETEAQAGLSVTLVDREGTVTASQDLGFLARNARRWSGTTTLNVRDLAGSARDRSVLSALLAGLESEPDQIRTARLVFNGTRSLVAASALPGLGWTIIAAVSLDRVLTVRTFALIPVVFLASLVLLLLAMAVLVDRLILVPLGSLTSAARQVARGRYEVALPAAGAGEIGVLARSFSTMAAEVRAATSNLEEQVRERTRQLADANERMSRDLDYALIVQRSILPDDHALDRRIPRRFVIFRPRDKVGGDFYFFLDAEDFFLVGVADCTGHGVSGALMSMYTRSALDSISSGVSDGGPAPIIREIDAAMRGRPGEGTTGLGGERGLDIGICRVEPRAGRLSFAGAGIDLFAAGPPGVRRIRGSRGAVGSARRRTAAPIQVHELPLDGWSFFMTTDGALDLGGGPRGFGFGSGRFAALAASCASLPPREQRERIDAALQSWQGALPQRDDITVLGFAAGGG